MLGNSTVFDFVAFPGGDPWGGRVTYGWADIQKSFQPMVDWIDQASITSNLYEYIGNATERRYYDSSDHRTDPNVFSAPFVNFTFAEIGDPLPGGASLGVASLYNLMSQLNLPVASATSTPAWFPKPQRL